MNGETGVKTAGTGNAHEGVFRVLKGEKGAKSGRKTVKKGKSIPENDSFPLLKQAAEMACEAMIELMADDKQFCRHAYQDKATGEIMEATLSLRNVKQMREAIQAIRDLTDAIRSLYGMLPPDAERELEVQLKKLEMEEKKLSQNVKGERNDTGVVILPAPEDADGG